MAMDMELGGVATWAIDMDDKSGDCGREDAFVDYYPPFGVNDDKTALKSPSGQFSLMRTINKAISLATLPYAERLSQISKNAAKSPSKEVVCYLASWSAYRPQPGQITPEDLDASLCTHIVYAFAGMDENTFAVKSLDPSVDLSPGSNWYNRVVKLKEKNPRLKVSISVGGWNEGSTKFSKMVETAAARKAFIDSAVAFLQKYKFDGLEIHWKHPGQRGGAGTDKANLVILAKEMKEAFMPHGLLLTAATGATKWALDTSYEFPALSDHLDAVHVLGYDYHGFWERTVGANAPLRGANNMDDLSVESTLEYLLEHSVPPSKIVLGLPLHGRTMVLEDKNVGDLEYGVTPTQGRGFGGPITTEDGFMAFNEICANIHKPQEWKRVWDDKTSTPYLRSGDSFITYDDHRSLALKVKMAMDMELGGVATWAIDMDDKSGDCGREDAFVDYYPPLGVNDDKTILKSPPGQYSLLKTINKAISLAALPYVDRVGQISKNTPKIPNKEVVCYLATWSAYRPEPGRTMPEDLDASLCTHIIYAFAGMDENTYTVKSLDPSLDLSPGSDWYARVVKLKEKNPRLKVSISMGGWNEGSTKFSKMVDAQERRKAFIKSAVEFLQKYKFDGLEMHWKHPGQRGGAGTDKANFVILAKEMKEAFKPHGLLLTAATGAIKWTLDTSYDFPALSEHLDAVHVLGYDYHGFWERTVGANAPLRGADDTDELSVEYTLKYLLEHNVPPSKIVLGVPLHGRTMILEDKDVGDLVYGVTATQGKGFPGPITTEDGFMAFNEICIFLKNTEWKRFWDNKTSTPYLRSGEFFITYDDHRSLAIKVKMAMDMQLAGIATWAIDMDDRSGDCGRDDAFIDYYPSLGSSNNKNMLASPPGPFSLMKTVNKAILLALEPNACLQGDLKNERTCLGQPLANTDTPITNTSQNLSPNTNNESTEGPTTDDEDDKKEIVCYLASWAANRPEPYRITPGDLDPFLCTHIIYAFARIDENTFVVKSREPTLDLSPGSNLYRSVVRLKDQNPNLKISIAVGGLDEGSLTYSEMAASSETRRIFINSAVAYLQRYRFDGLEIHWNYPGQRGGADFDKDNFVTLAKEMKAVFKPLGFLLTAAIGATRNTLDVSYKFPELSNQLDSVHVLAYNYHGFSDNTIGANAPLRSLDDSDDLSVDYTLKYLLARNVSAWKIVLGMPLHGRTMLLHGPINASEGFEFGITPTQGRGFAGPVTTEEGYLGFNEICANIQNRTAGWRRYWHYRTSTPYMVANNSFITYDDHRSLSFKVKMAMDLRLKGVATWSYDTDDRNGDCFRDDAFVDLYPALGLNDDKSILRSPSGQFSLLRTINRAIRLALEPPPVCNPTLTRVNGGTACAGQVIFQENFNSLNEDIWRIDQYIPVDHPEYPFVSYQRLRNDPIVKTNNGTLTITPRLQQDVPGFSNVSIYSGWLDLLVGCTSEFCIKQADGADILPPIVSGRITTKNFAFTYGTVDVRAKFPIGDWLYPEILLEPFWKKYGNDRFTSGVVKIAAARGNKVLQSDKKVCDNTVLYGGPIMDFHCRDKLINSTTSTTGRGWSDDYHIYSVRWDPNSMVFSVDGVEWGRIENEGKPLIEKFPEKCEIPKELLLTGTANAPFDTHFYLTLGVAAGGVTEFTDGALLETGPKPWANLARKAMYRFWQNTDKWYSTWTQPQLLVDYVRVVAL